MTFSVIMSARARNLLVVLLFSACAHFASRAFTYEPPGRDPVSIDNIRSSERAVRLTTDNFDELTDGKLVFVKFYSPGCPHCKSIAGAWNDLATYYEELPENDILIGSIDCTDSPGGKGLCAKFKIMGLPTLLYGDASFGGVYLEEYGGDKTIEQLKSFAAKALVPQCHPGNLDACSSDVRPQMEKFTAMPYNELDALIKDTEKLEEEARSSYKSNFAKLQRAYDKSLLEMELKVTRSRANVKLIKEVMVSKEN
ncbi:hypothetical protein ACHAWF_018072 [Thalassiosira exigua]